MLTIRREQMRLLASEASRAILIEHACTAHAAAVAARGREALEETATAVIRLCERYGLRTNADAVRMMDLALVFGADWQRPELRWLDEGLRDSAVAEPGLRLRKVWRRALRRLARETVCPSS